MMMDCYYLFDEGDTYNVVILVTALARVEKVTYLLDNSEGDDDDDE